ncbi:MAG: NAD(P)/FAD-dependent oxidoreductase [Clostridia bacterium]|nr:NAD(P)/FAD-dependent oxidoreductase [Clostridia bacterium]
MTDCIIVGSGMAGISAALTLKANGKDFLLFGSSSLSEKIEKAEMIRNYPGLSSVTGKSFVSALQKQLKEMQIEIKEEKVAGVYAMKDSFSVMMQNQTVYQSRSVILACGVESVKQIDGEEAFVGRGVSYCATCDGFLYKNKKILVLCTTKRLEHEINYLADIAEKVYLIPMYKDVEINRINVEIIRKMPLKIEGGKRVEKVVFSAPPIENLGTELAVDGVFMLRDSVSPAILVGGLQTQDGHVVVDRAMATNLKGCFAAGDCTGRPYQYAKAVGEGNVAAHSVTQYLK